MGRHGHQVKWVGRGGEGEDANTHIVSIMHVGMQAERTSHELYMDTASTTRRQLHGCHAATVQCKLDAIQVPCNRTAEGS